MTVSDSGPLPSTLTAITVTLIPIVRGQVERSTSNESLHTPFEQECAGTLAEPQVLPEEESEYVTI
jgi:hypothetical protein